MRIFLEKEISRLKNRLMRALVLALLSCLFFSASAGAMIVYGKTNEGAAVVYDSSGSAAEYSVVSLAGSSGVYLGGGWFLTANHVAVSNSPVVEQNGQSADVTYVYDTFSEEHGGVDLQLVYVEGAESKLDSLTQATLNESICQLVSARPTDLTFVAAGRGRAEGSAVDDSTVEWGDYSSREVRSSVDRFDGVFTQDGIDYFATDATPDEGSIGLASSDSGGGVFLIDGDTAYLVGIMVSASQLSSTVFGDGENGTYSVILNLTDYVSDINAIIANPPPIPEPSAFAFSAGLAALAGALAMRRRK